MKPTSVALAVVGVLGATMWAREAASTARSACTNTCVDNTMMDADAHDDALFVAAAPKRTPLSRTATTATATATATSLPPQPAELGIIRWRRGFQAARTEARASGKPLLVLFDEVPGCATVNAFGDGVLSDPIVADAAELLFVPVFVSNNEGGVDGEVLAHFGEPAWNNPVIRLMDADERPLAPRIEGAALVNDDHGSAMVLAHLITALTAANRPVPPWLQASADDVIGTDDATYAMGCFWTGEVALGAVPGVTTTSPGYAEGREVVTLRFDRHRTTRAAVDAAAAAQGFVPLTTRAVRPADSDDKKQLQQHRALQALTMSSSQRMHVNSALGRGDDVSGWLSPRQRALLDR